VDYTYDSSSIIDVDGDTGDITALACGETTIEISYTDSVCGGEPQTASIDVEVKGALTGLLVTPDTSVVDPLVLCVGDSDSFTLQAVYDCGRLVAGLVSLLGNDAVDYDYDTSIITVDNTGTITAEGFGETTIVISYTDSVCGGEPQTASIDVEVKEVAIVIDGILSPGEWYCATKIPIAGSMGNVWVLATTDYLYMAFNIVDPTDRRLGEGLCGNDKLSVNINPTHGGPWGKPYDIVFQTGTDPAAFTTTLPAGLSSGLSDSYFTEWVTDGTQYDLPGDLETMTIYSGNRISEWKIPLASIAPSVGEVLKVGGNADLDIPICIGYTFPFDLSWADEATYVDITVLY